MKRVEAERLGCQCLDDRTRPTTGENTQHLWVSEVPIGTVSSSRNP